MEVGIPNESVWLSELSVWSWSYWNDEITLVDLGWFACLLAVRVTEEPLFSAVPLLFMVR